MANKNISGKGTMNNYQKITNAMQWIMTDQKLFIKSKKKKSLLLLLSPISVWRAGKDCLPGHHVFLLSIQYISAVSKIANTKYDQAYNLDNLL